MIFPISVSHREVPMRPIAIKTQLVNVVVSPLINIVSRAGCLIYPAYGIARCLWSVGKLGGFGHVPFFATEEVFADSPLCVAECQIVPAVLRVAEQRELPFQLVGGVVDREQVLEPLTNLLCVNQCVAFALIGAIARDAPAFVPVKHVWRPPWPSAGGEKNGLASAVHCKAKRLAKRGQSMHAIGSPGSLIRRGRVQVERLFVRHAKHREVHHTQR